MDLYVRKILRVSVAQICQTIGYNSIQSIPLELLIDSLHKFLQEFARDLHRHVELFNRTEPNLDDVALSLQSLNISVSDLLEYINHVQPVACSIEIPELPASKSSNLNFLKPGSKEVLTRPVHIYEHLPPILRETSDADDKTNIAATSSPGSNAANPNSSANSSIEGGEDIGSKLTGQQLTDITDTSNAELVVVDNNNSTHQTLDGKRKSGLDSTVTPSTSAVPSSATREITSVMMTSGGFISPAIEGRMPESLIPEVVEKYFGLDAPPSVITSATAASQMPAPPGKTTVVPSSSTLNTPSSRSSNKNDDSTVSSTGLKILQTVDKKLLKKVKKKAMSTMAPPNIPGAPSPVLNDKAQRKRIKMLQKSMAKNGATAHGTYKTKGGNGITQGSQEKYLKKQYKIKQKQIRHQNVQKLMEAALGETTNISSNVRGGLLHASAQASEVGNSSKSKKDYFVVPAPVTDDVTGSDVSNSFLTSSPFPSSKGLYHHPSSGSQDIKLNSSLAQIPQSPLALPKYDEVKLSNEPDRSKLNIFKKISSSGRKERADAAAAAAAASTHPVPSTGAVQLPSNTDVTPATSSANTTIFGDDQVISLPSGTTITPAPPSGSGRHVYAPPPSTQPGDFDSVISVDDDGSIPEGSAVLMQRGDLMIHKPKKRGRKPGSKNQPKVLGLTTKKAKKLKKSFFGHSTSNLLEPLNLSHSSIANIANIPLGIASTFPIDPEAALKQKKERKKAKLGKDASFIRGTGKSPSARNLAPTKEEFASINQKLMMMDTVLQAAPPLSTSTHSSLTGKTGRSKSPSLGVAGSFPVDSEPPVKVKKERKKTKQGKDQKQLSQQSSQPSPTTAQTSKTSASIGSTGRKSPSPYTPNFSNVPGMSGLSMFPYYPFPARPSLIPAHNLFSQLSNMQNNALFIPSLMGFRPLNPPIRSLLKDEKELTPPPLQPGEWNYSKVAPLVPDTMKLELPPSSRALTSSPGVSGSKPKTSTISSTTPSKTTRTSPSTQAFPPPESNTGSSIPSTPGSTLHFSDFRKKCDEQNSSTVVSSSSGSNLNTPKNFAVTIEVSSDDSVQDEICIKSSSLTHRATLPSTVVSSTSGLRRQSHPSHDYAMNDDISIVEDSDTSHTERRSKEHKKFKKIGKQCKKQTTLGGSSEFKNPNRVESAAGAGVSGGFDDDDVSSMLIDITSEPSKKNDDSANSSGHTAFEYGISPERRKDHKKMKKLLKEGKLKKKKDKKDKNKNKDRSEKLVKSEKSEKRKEEKKDKDKLKKLKKEKKKEKQRTDMEVTAVKYTSSGEGTGSATDVSSVVPKLTLKLGQSIQAPATIETQESRKISHKASVGSISGTVGGKTGGSILCTSSGRELSPELARISPLVTRPPKQKSATDDAVSSSSMGNVNLATGNNSTGTSQTTSNSHLTPTLSASLNIVVDSVIDIDSNSGGPTTSMLPASATILGLGMNPTSSKSPGTTVVVASSTSSSTVVTPVHSGSSQQSQHQAAHLHTSAAKHSAAVPLISEANRPSSYIDAEGNRVWICPACGKVDDGSAMIGCDGCDAWYHWVCVGIFVAPNDNEDWYCRVCIAKKRGLHGGDRKRKRNKKKNINT